MIVGIALVVFMVVAVPVGVMAGGAIWSAAIGWVFGDDNEPAPSSPAGS